MLDDHNLYRILKQKNSEEPEKKLWNGEQKAHDRTLNI